MIREKIFFAQLDITGKCNLNCLFCRQASTKALGDELGINDLKKIVDELLGMQTEHLSIAGGEPLTSPLLEKLLAYAHGKIRVISLLTNGTLIGDREAHMLKKYLNYAQVSLDAASEKLHDNIRGKNSFSMATRGIRNLIDAGVKTFVRITVFKDNAREAIPLMHWCKANGVSRFSCRRVIISGKGANVQALSPAELKEFLSDVAETGKKIQLPVEFGDPFPDLFLKTFRRSEADRDKDVLFGLKAGGCSVGLDAIYITQNGFVCLCPYLPIYCGDLKKETVKEIWQNSKTYQMIRSLRYNLQGKCGICKYRFACGGCRAVAFYATGNICAEDSGCWYNGKD